MTGVTEIRLRRYDLALKKRWRMFGAAVSRRDGWLIEARTRSGLSGWGDFSVIPGQTTAMASPESFLRAASDRLIDCPLADALERLPAAKGIRSALECALLDALAKSRSLPLRRLLNANAADSLAVNGLAAPDGIPEALNAGFRVIKVKVGHRPLRSDLHWLKTLRLPEGVRLRLDANRAWTRDEAMRVLDSLSHLAVDCLEEPLAEPTIEGLAALQRNTPVTLALDESLPELGIARVLAERPVRRLVLKIGALGGLRAALALAAQAHAAKLECVITSALDSAVGVAAAAHLAAAAGIGPLAHGLSTASWLAEDVAVPLAVTGGRLDFDQCPGLGVSPS